MAADNLRSVLQQITNYDRNVGDGRRQLARRLFAFYLEAALSSHDKSFILSAIELPNRDGGWTSATQVALDGHGVVPTALLHSAFAELFDRATMEIVRNPDSEPEPEQQPVADSAARLREYFQPWRHHVPMTPVGAFV